MDLNTLPCATDIKNLGYGDCYLNPAFMKGVFFVPGKKTYTQAELDDFKATLVAQTLAPSKSNRVYPLHGFKTITPSNEATVFQTMGDGTQVPVRDGNYNMTFDYLDGGLCLSMNLRSFNNRTITVLFYDANFTFFGWRKQLADGTYGLAGVPVIFRANPWEMNTGAAVSRYTVYFSMQPTYLNDTLGFYQADFNPEEIKALQTIALKQTGVSLAGVFSVQAFTGCDASNLYALYSTELPDSSLWNAFNKATGGRIVITTVVADPDLGAVDNKGAFTITLDDEDANYPATALGDISITLVDPTALDAADVSGYESNVLTVKRG